AVEVYQKALTLKPDWTEGHWHLGLALWRQGKHQEALESYQKALALKPDWAEGHFYIASALLEIGQHKEAIENYQQAVALKPEWVDAHWELGSVLWQQGETQAAIATYQKVINSQPDLALSQGEKLRQKGKLDEAIAIYQTAIELQPDSSKMLLHLGDLLLQQNKLDEASQKFEQAILIQPDLIEAHLQLAETLRRTGDLDKAVRCGQRVVDINPSSVEAYFHLGNLLIMQGKIDQAMQTYYRLNQLKFDKTRSQGNIGTIFLCLLPKSASTYIWSSLVTGLGLPLCSSDQILIEGGRPDYYIRFRCSELFTQSLSGIITYHTNASEWNLRTISLILDRLVVNVRDPRQGLISTVHHHNRVYEQVIVKRQESMPLPVEMEMLAEYSTFPENYFSLSLTEQIDWQIENGYLPMAIKWIEEWVDAEKNPLFYPKILFTRQEDLATNPQKFFEEILRFYEIENSRFTFPEPPKFRSDSFYRKGSIDEWREVLTPQQAEKASSMIPKRLLDRFGWF
ncbi:tetratricopeptide repeat protein, partial [Microcoleus sp.]|uniref:tetratricopeptide repeat protein n=1 Tax=Microcoleus sp. TaxID=44472 RepID=UPI0035267306